VETANSGKVAQDFGILFSLGKGLQLFFDITPIQDIAVSQGNTFSIAYIYGAGGEQLHHQEVFGGASAEFEARQEFEGSCPLD
jgi:hypothetical protein